MAMNDVVTTASVELTGSVLVVDDHLGFAEMLAAALTAIGMTVLGIACSGAKAVAMAQEMRPDVVIMDIQMPQQDGLSATRRIREVSPDSMIAVVTAHRDPEWLVRAAQAGAAAFIPKTGSLSEMIDVLGRARAGQMVVAPSAFAGRPGESGDDKRADGTVRLTKREQQVLECLSRGLGVKAIARVLGITELTCRGYVKHLHAKLDAHTQLEALVRAQELGLLAPAGAARPTTGLPIPVSGAATRA